jgi:hypothetical protein
MFDAVCFLTGDRLSDVFEERFPSPTLFCSVVDLLVVDITPLDLRSAVLYKCVLGVKT